MIDQIEALVVHTEAEALLAEQNFIKQYKPRFNIRLRDDKSYPYIAISLDEDFPRVYFTRERHRRDRAYFGPFSNARRVRQTLDVLGKVFMFRSCEGPTPGRHSGSPCLDYYIKRCEAPCVGYVSREEYRAGIDGVIAFLSGRYRQIERELEFAMKLAAAEQRFEDAARERNRLRAVRSLLERQRIASDTAGTLDAIAVAVGDGEANAQVFQVRDGVLADRQSFYLDNSAEGDVAAVAEAFILQYYGSAMMIPPLLVVQRELEDREPLAEALAARRGGSGRDPRRRARRQAPDPRARRAQRAAGAGPGEAPLRAPPPAAGGGARRPAAGARAGHDPAADRVLRHLHADGHEHGRVDGRVRGRGAEEVRLPPLQGGRRPGIGLPDDFAAMEEVLGRRLARWEQQREVSPHDKEYDASFATLPNLIVIDGGKGQLSAGLRALAPFRDAGRGRGVAGQADRGGVHPRARAAPLRLAHDTPELQLLQRVRDEAHRFAITHHRIRRDRAMTASILDDLPGVGPARKRALLAHFGSPDAILGASREELEAVPGLPGKLARELHRELHKTGV